MFLIFDVDGTIAESGKEIDDKMLELLETRKKKYEDVLILVGGGNYQKILWQIKGRYDIFDTIFSCCGAEMYKNDKLVYKKNFVEKCDRKLLNDLLKICLREIADMDIVYSGGQIDFRSGLVYVSPVGMQANEKERSIFMELDKKKDVRRKLIDKLRSYDNRNEFEIVLGGSVGIAIYPKGWDKSQIMEVIKTDKEIYFFGDKTEKDGNDYPLFIHPGVKGVSVKDESETYDILRKIDKL